MKPGSPLPFGCAPYRTESESEYAKIQYGISFHVGEQQRNCHKGKGSAAVLK
jgi:hypothetical protein